MSRIARTTARHSIVLFVVVAAGYVRLIHADVPQVPSNTWATTGDLTSVRAGASGTLLVDGRVLVVGGVDGDGVTATAERFSPSGGGFLATPPMQTSRANHTATLLADGRVLVAGGTGVFGTAEPSAELYDPSVNAWFPAGPLHIARRGHTATFLDDGRVLVAGGDDGGQTIDSLEVFDPTTLMFTVVDGGLNGPRTQHAAAPLLDGRVLIAGGYDGTSALAATSLYDDETGTVTPGPDLSTPRSGLTATTLVDGRVLIAGGAGADGELASAEVFDPSSNTVTATDNMLAVPRQNHLALLLPHNNRVLMVGGLSSGSPVAAAEYFTPWEGANGTFCAAVICASGYPGPAQPNTARVWATGTSLSFPADRAIRSGPTDGLLLLAGGSGQRSAELFGFATVRTDKEDYAPGETVTITGSGWQPGEWVALLLKESPNLDEHTLVDVQADDRGNIESREFVPDEHDLNIRFYATAFGGASQAQTTFRDSIGVSAATITTRDSTCTTPTGVFAQGQTVCAQVVVTGTSGTGAAGSFFIIWRNAANVIARTVTKTVPASVPTTFTDTFATPGTSAPGTWTVLVCSSSGSGCTTASSIAHVTFALVNPPPTADTKTVSTHEDTALDVPLSGSDTGTCELTFSIVSGPSHGSLGSIANKTCISGSPRTDTATVLYTPVANYNGPDSFVYKVNDGNADSAGAMVSMTIDAVNDPPVVTLSGDSGANEGQAKHYSVTTTDPDAGNTFSLDANCSAGTKSNQTFNTSTGAGSFDCQFLDGPMLASVNVKVSDGDVSDTDSISVTVNNVPPSVLSSFGASAVSCGSNNATLSASFTDPGTDTFSASINWGDGSPAQTLQNVSSPFTVSHTYALAGPYNATVEITDDDSGVGSDVANAVTVNLIVVGGGILPPMRQDGHNSFKSKSTIPVKIQLQNCDGSSLSSLAPRIRFYQTASATPAGFGGIPLSTSAADTAGVMRSTGSPDNQFIFNLAAKHLPEPSAAYLLEITIPLTDQKIYVNFELKP